MQKEYLEKVIKNWGVKGMILIGIRFDKGTNYAASFSDLHKLTYCMMN